MSERARKTKFVKFGPERRGTRRVKLVLTLREVALIMDALDAWAESFAAQPRHARFARRAQSLADIIFDMARAQRAYHAR